MAPLIWGGNVRHHTEPKCLLTKIVAYLASTVRNFNNSKFQDFDYYQKVPVFCFFQVETPILKQVLVMKITEHCILQYSSPNMIVWPSWAPNVCSWSGRPPMWSHVSEEPVEVERFDREEVAFWIWVDWIHEYGILNWCTKTDAIDIEIDLWFFELI